VNLLHSYQHRRVARHRIAVDGAIPAVRGIRNGSVAVVNIDEMSQSALPCCRAGERRSWAMEPERLIEYTPRVDKVLD